MLANSCLPSHVFMAPDLGSLKEEFDLPGTLPQVSWQRGREGTAVALHGQGPASLASPSTACMFVVAHVLRHPP